ncbi:hypothetical protein Tco_0266293 [Tanacetum coccineum]
MNSTTGRSWEGWGGRGNWGGLYDVCGGWSIMALLVKCVGDEEGVGDGWRNVLKVRSGGEVVGWVLGKGGGRYAGSGCDGVWGGSVFKGGRSVRYKWGSWGRFAGRFVWAGCGGCGGVGCGGGEGSTGVSAGDLVLGSWEGLVGEDVGRAVEWDGWVDVIRLKTTALKLATALKLRETTIDGSRCEVSSNNCLKQRDPSHLLESYTEAPMS